MENRRYINITKVVKVLFTPEKECKLFVFRAAVPAKKFCGITIKKGSTSGWYAEGFSFSGENWYNAYPADRGVSEKPTNLLKNHTDILYNGEKLMCKAQVLIGLVDDIIVKEYFGSNDKALEFITELQNRSIGNIFETTQ